MLIDGKRALCYTAKIEEVKPIEGYDRVEYARVLGWWVIVSKQDNFKSGDLCIYFEIDSRVPSDDERFDFLEKRNYRIKTQRMCKVISQGLIMPLTLFPEINVVDINVDLTDTLKVRYAVEEDNKRKSNPNKYKSMADRKKALFKKQPFKYLMTKEWGRKLLFTFFGKKKDNGGGFPTKFPYISKTDEERVENMPWVLGYKDPLIVTEKLDGTSCTYILEKKPFGRYEFYILSRNLRQYPNKETYHQQTGQDTGNIYCDLAIKYDIENKLKDYLKSNPDLTYVCIQGEGVGKVQGNPLKLKENDLYVFNFIDSKVGRHDSLSAYYIIRFTMDMKFVPIISNNYYMPNDMEEFKLFADGKSAVNPEVNREGFVLRDPKTGLSFKNVSREYLLNKGE